MVPSDLARRLDAEATSYGREVATIFARAAGVAGTADELRRGNPVTVVGLMVLTGLLHLAVAALVVGPLAWWTCPTTARAGMAEGGGRTLVAAAGVYVGSLALLSPHVGLFADLVWNWQNKALLSWDSRSWWRPGERCSGSRSE